MINLVVVLVLELVSVYSPFTTRFKDYILRPLGPNTALKLHLVPLGPTAMTGPDVAVIKVDTWLHKRNIHNVIFLPGGCGKAEVTLPLPPHQYLLVGHLGV